MSLNNLSKTLIPFLSIILIIPTLFIPTISNSTDLEINRPDILHHLDA